jgi:hypothetical protein
MPEPPPAVPAAPALVAGDFEPLEHAAQSASEANVSLRMFLVMNSKEATFAPIGSQGEREARTMSDNGHKILAHGDLQELMPGVWTVTGALPFPLKRVMTIVRLSDGSLLLHSVIAMDEARMAKLEALGKPSIVIVPHAGHRLDATFYKKRYPEVRVVAPAAARAKIEEVVELDATAEETLPALGVKLHPVDGFKNGELAYELATPGGKVLVMSDAVANRDPPPGFRGWLMASMAGGPKNRRLSVPRIVRMMILGDKKAARASIEKLAEIPDLKLLTVAHGRAITDGVSGALREAAADLG